MAGHTDQYRLPTNVKPTHYDLAVKTDLEDLKFEGFVKISLDVKEETSKVVLNVSELELGNVLVWCDALDKEQAPVNSHFDSVSERVVYELKSPLPTGSKAVVKIGFSGKLTGSMMGYYRSSWTKDGKTNFYALTQFEPTAARRAFPSLDEPLLKATFDITLISRTSTTSLSNMPAISETTYSQGYDTSDELLPLISGLPENGQWKITKFETTPPMSTYIVAYANGEFAYLEKSVVLPLSGKTVPLRIYATADIIHQAQFALDVKAAVLPLYEKVFDVGYPLPKLDTLVVCAMENWGLITGRTSALLLDPKNADLQAKKQVATTQSHEVAHMWFGNITTMEWWNYLYLNEGIIMVFPEWRVDSEFICDHLNKALALDSKYSSHPIEVECPDANHINQIFDSLSYSKAASVLRMLSNYVGEDKFLHGVSLYLKKKLYGNSVTNDLWEGITKATGVDITKMMDNWISKIGYPVLTVTENNNGIFVRQDRFLEIGLADEKDNQTIWNVPLSILVIDENGKTSIDRTVVLQERENFIPLDTNKPYKLNAGTTGVYRVLYTSDRLKRIAVEAAKTDSVFSLNDRIGLVYDAMAVSKAGLAKLSSALTLIDILRNEKEYLVWSGISDNLRDLVSTWWEHEDIVDQLNAFRRALFVPIVKQLGFDYSNSEPTEVTELRTCAISQAAAACDEGVITELKKRFHHYMKTGDDSQIPADLQRIIYAVATRHGGREEYEAVVQIHDMAKTPTSRIAAIHAMGAPESADLLEETFKFMETKAKNQDIVYFFRGLSTNFKARRLLAKYFMDEYNNLYKRFEGNFNLQYLVSFSMGALSSPEDLTMINTFFKDKDTSKYNQSLAQAEDTIRAKIGFVERSTGDLANWLSEWKKRETL
ncbi:leucyl aminopeptidase [Cyathus striatus]|nr:leucyl aminopeptidase [Cyathus striatus]